jgi:recombination DNA repair RAD52 pathway protein
MAHIRRTGRKSTGCLLVGQLAPRNVPQPQEFQPDIPQEASLKEEPFEIELVVPESPTAQDSPAEQQQSEDHGTEDKTDEEQPPPSDTEPEKMYQDADEVESFRAESPILTGRLRALLEHLGITTAPRYRIKEVPCPGRVEFKAIAEIFFGSRILCRHRGSAFRTSRSDAVADAAWQAITSWVHSNKSWLQNLVHYLLPYQKKDQFKAYRVKKDISRMEMVHHQDVAVELSTHLLTAQHEIETLHAQL